MRYDSNIVNLLLNGHEQKAINTWNKVKQRVIRSEPSSWTYSQFNSIYGTIDYILNSDNFIKSAVNKRLYLLKAYDYTVAEEFERFVREQLDTFFDILYNVIFFGKCLVQMEIGINGWKIKIIPPQNYYKNEDGVFKFLTDDEYKVNTLLYFGNPLFDISAIGISVVNLAIQKDHNRVLWYNNNIYLNGFLHSTISKEVIEEAKLESDNEDITITKIADKLVNDINNLSLTSGVLNTPDGTKISHLKTANDTAGDSYKLFIHECKTDIENVILGRGTQQNDTTYASEKIRYLSTSDIQFADIKTLEKVVNNILDYIKWGTILQQVPSNFNISEAIDEDEINVLSVLNSIRNLGGVDKNDQPVMIPIDWLSKTTRIPFVNKGNLQLGVNTWIQQREEQIETRLELQNKYAVEN